MQQMSAQGLLPWTRTVTYIEQQQEPQIMGRGVGLLFNLPLLFGKGKAPCGCLPPAFRVWSLRCVKHRIGTPKGAPTIRRLTPLRSRGCSS